MIPENVGRRLWAEFHCACKIYGAAFVDMKVGSAKDGRCWHCTNTRTETHIHVNSW